MKKIRVFATVYGTNGFGDSLPVLVAGEHPVTPETERQVALGNGQVFDAPDEAAQLAAEPALTEAAEPAAATTKASKAKAA